MKFDVKKEHRKQNIRVAVDNCIFTIKNNGLCVLLIEMKHKLIGKWALPGGLIANHETAEQAAAKILKEQTAVTEVYLEQLFTFSALNRDPFDRVVSIAYFALIPDIGIKLKTIEKYKSVKWWEVKKLPELAYDHAKIIKTAKERLASKISYTNIAWSLLPPKFTLTQLQKVYETILNKPLDKRNFRKKLLALNLVAAAGEKTNLDAHRPAMLYKFKTKKPKIVEII